MFLMLPFNGNYQKHEVFWLAVQDSRPEGPTVVENNAKAAVVVKILYWEVSKHNPLNLVSSLMSLTFKS